MNKGLKPEAIDLLGAKAVQGKLSPFELDDLKTMDDDFSEKLLRTDSKTNFIVAELFDFEWNPVLKTDFVKTDILNKDSGKCPR